MAGVGAVGWIGELGAAIGKDVIRDCIERISETFAPDARRPGPVPVSAGIDGRKLKHRQQNRGGADCIPGASCGQHMSRGRFVYYSVLIVTSPKMRVCGKFVEPRRCGTRGGEAS